jgi:sterol desaturase/sphingolipid hydroxylase (fatty acid hydroxylase superfamily)
MILLVAFFGTILWGSFGEWLIHRFVMHTRQPLLPYPYELHAVGHHGMFGADASYHAQDEEMKKHVTFDPKDYFFILSAHVPGLLAFEWLTGIALSAPVAAVAILGCTGAFDILHWKYHVPSDTWFQRTRLFRFLKEHHRLHHLRQDRNYNVFSLPLADWCLGTLITKESRN